MKAIGLRVFTLLLLWTSTAQALDVQGTLPSHTTWRASDSPIVMLGDVTVPAGTLLTIEPGTIVQAKSSDALAMGEDPLRVELIVQGSLRAIGSATQKIQFTSESNTSNWYGIRFELTSAANSLASVDIQNGFRAFTVHAPLELVDSTVQNFQDACLLQFMSTVNVERSQFQACGRDGIFVGSAGQLTMKQVLLHSSGSRQPALRLQGQANLENCTVANNASGGVDLFGSKPITIINTIIANNRAFGIRYSGMASVSLSYSNLFGHTQNFANKALNSFRVIQEDPQFMGPTDYRLKSTSPSRQTGENGVDMGAFPAVAALHHITLSHNEITANTDGKVSLVAQAFDEANNLMNHVQFQWQVLPQAGILTLNPADSSRAEWNAACKAPVELPEALTVTSHGVSQKIKVKIVAGSPSKLSLSPIDPIVSVNEKVTFTAQAVDSCQHPVPASVTWSATNGAISASGEWTAPTEAKTFTNAILAKLGTLEGKTSVTVRGGAATTLHLTETALSVKPRQSLKVVAEAKDQYGNPSKDTISWQCESNAGTITADGQFTATTQAGFYPDALTAKVGNESAKVSVTITPGAGTKISVSPQKVKVPPKGFSGFSATVKDAYDNPTNETVTWTMLKSEAGSINANGQFTASATAGTYLGAVQASIGGASARAEVIIEPGAISQVAVLPAKIKVGAGESVAFTASGKDEFGNPVQVTPTWNVQGMAGTISAAGVFKAGTLAGTYENAVVVEINGNSGTATVEIVPGPVKYLNVSPTNVDLFIGTEMKFTATAKDAFGNSIDSPQLQWQAVPQAGSINAEGVFRAGKLEGNFPRGVSVTSGSITSHVGVIVYATTSDRIETVDCSHVSGSSWWLWGAFISAFALKRRRSLLHRVDSL